LDSPREEAYDRIVRMASVALDVPAAAITVIDGYRQFVKSVVGFGLEEVRETTIERSICQYTIASGEPLFVEDARVHPLLSTSPVVIEKLLVAYAGVPVIDGEGYFVGTLCVWDDKPRLWSRGHVRILTDLAAVLRERIFGASDA
jgi:GAF domain-containing protein